MNSEPNPNAQMPVGKACHATDVGLGDWEGVFEGGESMCEMTADCQRPVSAAPLERDCTL
ncbi:MAG TPA: hypothetical protein VJ022_10790 [Anaerolineales bacterium]|nr:hypothetical protein [Anaerolineales bacterium]